MNEFDLMPLAISLKTTLLATAIVFVLGLIAARAVLHLSGGVRAFWDGVFTLPMVLPPTVVGFILLLIFGKNSPLGEFLINIGARVIFTWYGAVIAATVVAFPMMYRTTRGAFEQLDINIIHAAKTLGFSDLEIFVKIMIPASWPGIAAGTILAFSRALGEFGATLMIAGNIPGQTQTMPLAIFFAAESGDMQRALFWVAIVIVISFITIFAVNYWDILQKRILASKRGGQK